MTHDLGYKAGDEIRYIDRNYTVKTGIVQRILTPKHLIVNDESVTNSFILDDDEEFFFDAGRPCIREVKNR